LSGIFVANVAPENRVITFPALAAASLQKLKQLHTIQRITANTFRSSTHVNPSQFDILVNNVQLAVDHFADSLAVAKISSFL